MHKVSRTVTALLVAFLPVTLTACGGDDDSSAALSSDSASATPGAWPPPGRAAPLDYPVRGQDFTVWMPGKPTLQPWRSDGELLLFKDGSSTYYAGQFPRGSSDRLDVKGVVQATARAVKGRIVSQQSVTVLGQPGREARFVYTKKGKTFTSFFRLISTPQRVFVLQFMTPGENVKVPPAEYRSFVDSFRLRPGIDIPA
jgi:hypothetical protein